MISSSSDDDELLSHRLTKTKAKKAGNEGVAPPIVSQEACDGARNEDLSSPFIDVKQEAGDGDVTSPNGEGSLKHRVKILEGSLEAFREFAVWSTIDGWGGGVMSVNAIHAKLEPVMGAIDRTWLRKAVHRHAAEVGEIHIPNAVAPKMEKTC